MYFIDISRGIVMRGAGIAELWPKAVVLIVYTAVVLALATWLVRKRVA